MNDVRRLGQAIENDHLFCNSISILPLSKLIALLSLTLAEENLFSMGGKNVVEDFRGEAPLIQF